MVYLSLVQGPFEIFFSFDAVTTIWRARNQSHFSIKKKIKLTTDLATLFLTEHAPMLKDVKVRSLGG